MVFEKFYNFKTLFYSLKFKNKIRTWLYNKVIEPFARKKYHPSKLQNLLKNIEDNDAESFDKVTTNW